ncbi:hypothetical protein EVAR_64031_1 [Eumeta japonica]|uniref:HAT C-terminal dimerisation domain-containing protein n=1 Tax=Eumeta variegata TaxID=151549 RepID=A0A4C1Z6G6_EUMVA|nr:hypothetical protein EVAR_64031_1 [Eumeta japonica]
MERPGTTGRQSCLISDLAMILDSSSDDESQKTPEINSPDVILKKELLTFRNKKRINLNECPLKWWSVNQSEFKLLSKMARKFLSAPPASVPTMEVYDDFLLHASCQERAWVAEGNWSGVADTDTEEGVAMEASL